MRKVSFVVGEFYHIYNRGVDKRNIFGEQNDLNRFMQSIDEFNVREPIGSIYENSFLKKNQFTFSNSPQLGRLTSKLGGVDEKLVAFVAYCINPNHFHFLLTPKVENGTSEFMKRLGGGYTKFFNNKYGRTGALFQGLFKSSHVSSNEYLLYLSAYINLNDHVHQLGRETSKLVRSSFSEYVDKDTTGFCAKEIILKQFRSRKEYAVFAEKTVEEVARRRLENKELNILLLE